MIKIGEKIPDVQLSNHEGESVKLHDFLGEGPIVIFFYPKNETPGCVAEACEFRDMNEDFHDKGATIIGISGDSSESHAKYRKKYKFEFPLLSDTRRKAEKAFGLKRDLFGLLPARVTFIIDSKGQVGHVFQSATKVREHARKALKFIERESKKTMNT